MSTDSDVKKIIITDNLLKEVAAQSQEKIKHEIKEERKDTREHDGPRNKKKKIRQGFKHSQSSSKEQNTQKGSKKVNKDDESPSMRRERVVHQDSSIADHRSSTSPPGIRDKQNSQPNEKDLLLLAREIVKTTKKNWLVYK